ncbi:MAG: ABC transporter permease [Candidatus Zixiibacteriota bacterium]
MSLLPEENGARLRRLFSEYGMLGVLVLLSIFFSVLTMSDQYPTGEDAAKSLFERRLANLESVPSVVIVTTANLQDSLFASELSRLLRERSVNSQIVAGDPQSIRSQMELLAESLGANIVLATSNASLPVVKAVATLIPEFDGAGIFSPSPRRWPTFLLAENIRNVANQITVIAIVAIGMTIVIITAGIDLSVGSLIALSAVIVTWLIGRWGAESAGTGIMLAAASIGIVISGIVGAFSGLMITRFRIPPFIATLAMMQVAAGIAYIISQGRPIYQIPDSFIWLGRGVDPVFGIPTAVILMIVLYAVAHIVMSRTVLGRYIYAVGGNPEAARLSGIRVQAILFFAYTICAMLAGLGGVLMASQLKSGAPTYGLSYELYVIAAVVVGGTSLSGGEGRILGTLIGALIIGVIQNGMNLVNVESYTQKVVLGLVILGAVLLDRLKQTRWRFRKTAA